MADLSLQELDVNTWDFRIKSENSQEYFHQLAMCVNTTGETTNDIFYLLGLINYCNRDSITANNFAIRWELYRINDTEIGTPGTIVSFSDDNTTPNIYTLGDDTGGKSQCTLTFPLDDNHIINSNLKSFVLKLYIVRANYNSNYLTEPLTIVSPGDYIDNPEKKSNIGYLGGFKITFTFANNLTSYTVKMATNIADNLKEKYVSVADFFDYHSLPDANGQLQNEAIFEQNGIDTSVSRSELAYNLGALGSSVSFSLNNVDKRVTADVNRNYTTFADVYGNNPSNFTITYWQTRLKLCGDNPTISTGNTNTTLIGSPGVNGWQWQWASSTPNINSITYSSENGLTIVSPFVINLNTATYDGSGNSMIEWTNSERLDFLGRSNFYMFFEHTFGLQVQHTRTLEKIFLNIHTKNIQMSGIGGQSTTINIRYNNSIIGILEAIFYKIYYKVNNRDINIIIIFFMLVIFSILH